MKKVLVCGSAGFLMSNLMRYMLYRTKDYDFVSVDQLRQNEDFNKVYLHRKHKFYIGDVGNHDFISKILYIEKPDVTIISTTAKFPTQSLKVKDVENIILPTATICDISTTMNTRIIRLVPDLDVVDQGDKSMWRYIESMVINYNGTVLRLPNCFGYRGKGDFENSIKMIATGMACKGWAPCKEYGRYTYAEDVASMIWFLIENSQHHNIVHMPALGEISPYDMIAISSDIHGWSLESQNKSFKIEDSTVSGWIPDSNSIEEAINRTVKWYMMNKWVFNK